MFKAVKNTSHQPPHLHFGVHDDPVMGRTYMTGYLMYNDISQHTLLVKGGKTMTPPFKVTPLTNLFVGGFKDRGWDVPNEFEHAGLILPSAILTGNPLVDVSTVVIGEIAFCGGKPMVKVGEGIFKNITHVLSEDYLETILSYLP